MVVHTGMMLATRMMASFDTTVARETFEQTRDTPHRNNEIIRSPGMHVHGAYTYRMHWIISCVSYVHSKQYIDAESFRTEARPG